MKDKTVILVVDDQPPNIKLLEAYLIPQGYEIIKAENGEEALRKLSGNQIDLILLDVIMPGIDGFEVTRRVRQDDTYRLLPIILVTALRETEDRVKGIDAGCDDFISKPVDKMELLARVRSLLRVKAYNDLMSNYQKELESEVTRRTEELNHTLENLQQEVTERQQAEELLLRERSLVDRIMRTSPAGITVTDLDGRIIFANKRAEGILGLSIDKITGLTYESSKWPITDFDGNSFPIEKFPFAMVITSGSPIYGIRNAIDFPDGRRVYLSINGAPIYDEKGNINEVVFSIDDITDRQQAEEKLKYTIESLRKAISTTIQVLISAVEVRDPYTAGHQMRSSALASAIATEMGLAQEKIDGIRMASSIHDIGKLSIPAEILSKPAKLSEPEFSMIKEHARKGFEMLKDVESPWPLAEIVYQHHERMDGSGYPRNLKGDEILMEARIMAVADVVEAMASHRPYRPGLGIDTALDEIEKNRGIFYDDAVADACLRLFREKGFKLEGT